MLSSIKRYLLFCVCWYVCIASSHLCYSQEIVDTLDTSKIMTPQSSLFNTLMMSSMSVSGELTQELAIVLEEAKKQERQLEELQIELNEVSSLLTSSTKQLNNYMDLNYKLQSEFVNLEKKNKMYKNGIIALCVVSALLLIVR